MSPVAALGDFQREFDAAVARRDWRGAIAVATACHRSWPDAVQGWLFISIVALRKGDASGALAVVDECLGQHPECAECLLQRAECLRELGRRSDMLRAIHAAADRAGDDVRTIEAVGDFLFGIGEFELAVRVLDRAVKAAPDNMALLGKRAEFLRSLGRIDAAARDYEAVMHRLPGEPFVLLRLVELRRQTLEQNMLPALYKALTSARTGTWEAAMLHFALAKVHDDLGEYLTSWRHLTTGNRFERARIQYDPQVKQALVERIIAVFSEVEAVVPDITLERPIFIVGLPRTGTTLVDRIISAHSQVHSAGELTAFSEAVVAAIRQCPSAKSGSTLEHVKEWPVLDPGLIARKYLAGAQLLRGEKPRFCDKHPMNFLQCALILRAFPNARIVHLTRHPLATCHAIYKARFAKYAFPCAYDLDELGNFYVAYRKLMSHWHRVLPGRILDVAYEEVVTALEPTTRRLLDYLELPFEAACLFPHRNPAASTTASAVQVRQPVYNTSLRRWRHYADQLAPLGARLEAAGIAVDEVPLVDAPDA